MPKLRIRLTSPGADCLLGQQLRVDGLPVGKLTSTVTEIAVDRGWHILEVRDRAHPTRALRFRARPDGFVEAEVLEVESSHFDPSWFELEEVSAVEA